MSSALTLIKKREKALADEDEQIEKSFVTLAQKRRRTSDEEKEMKKLGDAYGAMIVLQEGTVIRNLADKEMQPVAERLHKELAAQYDADTPLKRLLIERLVAAWNMAYSYEHMFKVLKYREKEKEEGGGYRFFYDAPLTNHLREIRKGVESANAQIIRLGQALEDLVNPPIKVKTTNAFFAQNQQINQGDASKIPQQGLRVQTVGLHHGARPGTAVEHRR